MRQIKRHSSQVSQVQTNKKKSTTIPFLVKGRMLTKLAL